MAEFLNVIEPITSSSRFEGQTNGLWRRRGVTAVTRVGGASHPGRQVRLRAASPGTDAESLHFVLNDTLIKDNRIAAWGMRHDDDRVRDALPGPADQYGAFGLEGLDEHWDDGNGDGRPRAGVTALPGGMRCAPCRPGEEAAFDWTMKPVLLPLSQCWKCSGCCLSW